MSTFLFKYSVFGPIDSRRLGKSLGINILPTDFKLCNFDCVYCECGWTNKTRKPEMPSVESVTEELLQKIQMLLDRKVKIDTLTFAGNGEPTLHPDFEEIVSAVKNIRDVFLPQTKIAVLNNASLLNRSVVRSALKDIDLNICKLDAGTPDMMHKINQPRGKFNFDKIVENLKQNDGNLIIQSLFLKGEHNNLRIDNTTEEEVFEWLNLLKVIRPQHVMIYSLDRESPAKNLEIISKSKLYGIAKQVNKIGITASVA